MKTFFHKIEKIVDILIPYCLVLLLGVIIIEIFYHDIAHHYHLWIAIADFFIILVFILDLVFKYIRVRNVPSFLRRYWIEILAVFPFYMVFRGVEIFFAFVPVSESMQSFQMILHEGLEIEKEGSKIVKEVGQGSRYERFLRFMRPVFRVPRFFKVAAFFEKPTGGHHHYENA